MFRRRPPRRRPARPVPPGVRQAERLFRQGRFEQAAGRFRSLAQEAAQRGLWGPAARLHLRAGQAFLEAGQVEQAVEDARRGLGAMVRAGRPAQAGKLFRRVVRSLEERGYHEQAEALRQEAAQQRKGRPGPRGRGAGRYVWPTNCPNCGATLTEDAYRPVRPDAVECTYCGSLVQAHKEESS